MASPTPSISPTAEAERISQVLTTAERRHYLDSPPADLFIRTGALLLDGMLVWLLMSGAFKATLLILAVLHRTPVESIALTWAFRGLAYAVYTTVPLHVFGGTPGKILLGLRVIDSHSGAFLSLPRAFARECLGKVLTGSLLGLPVLPALSDPQRQLMHDRFAGCVVRKVHEPL